MTDPTTTASEHEPDHPDLAHFSGEESPIPELLQQLHERFREEEAGVIADYIPELARAKREHFGLAITTVAGQTFTAGDAHAPFTMQSTMKPFLYGHVLETHGRGVLHERMGVEPSGDRFDSIIRLDQFGRPHNPMVNAGAILLASMVEGADASSRLRTVLEVLGRYAGSPRQVDASVFTSEKGTSHRNRALTHLMMHFKSITGGVDEHLELYFQLCSVVTTASDLSIMGATLANLGVNPVTEERAVPAEYLRDMLTVMFTCGLYDGAGAWAAEVGFPAKSGVAGGIVGVVPGVMGIGVYSPPLDHQGNALRGVLACKELARRLHLHVFDDRRFT